MKNRLPVAVNRPQLPPYERIATFLAGVDAARFYTNGGALSELLRERLAEHFGLGKSNVGVTSSGTAAITGLLLATAGRAKPERPYCLCPSFTFVATAMAAQTCGYIPWLVDVDSETWAIEPEVLKTLPGLERVGAVVVVAPLGRMVALQKWHKFTEQCGVPVVVDAAACFDTIDPKEVLQTNVPVAISLHATKTLSTAEGGLMLSGSSMLVERAMAAVNFGFLITRRSELPGFNGKLSEYHAAIGLADLEGWNEKQSGFLSTAAAYEATAQSERLQGIITNSLRATPYAHFLARDATTAARVTSAMDAEGIGWRRWYGYGLDGQPAFKGCLVEALPNTDKITSCLIGLPFSWDLGPETAERIVKTISMAAGQDGLVP